MDLEPHHSHQGQTKNKGKSINQYYNILIFVLKYRLFKIIIGHS